MNEWSLTLGDLCHIHLLKWESWSVLTLNLSSIPRSIIAQIQPPLCRIVSLRDSEVRFCVQHWTAKIITMRITLRKNGIIFPPCLLKQVWGGIFNICVVINNETRYWFKKISHEQSKNVTSTRMFRLLRSDKKWFIIAYRGSKIQAACAINCTANVGLS